MTAASQDPAAAATPSWQQPAGERTCVKCGKTKDVRAFFHSPGEPQGISTTCKACTTTVVEAVGGQKGGLSRLRPVETVPIRETLNMGGGREMSTREVRIGDGRTEANIAVAISQGRIAKQDAGAWGQAFAGDYESAIGMLTRLPTSVSEEAYLNYARATGVMSMRDDPRVGRSWERRQ